MIRSLRRRHRVMTTAIAIILPLLFMAGIAARKAIPRMEIPPALAPAEEKFSELIFRKSNFWPELDIAARVFADSIPPSRLAVELHPQRYLKIPDILVYWSETPASAGDKMPESAYLIGTLAGTEQRRFPLPPAALDSDGTLILYSLAQQKVIGIAALPTHSQLSGGGSR